MSAAARPDAPPRVLLVEDDAAIRRLVSLALEDEALALGMCTDVEEALALLAAGPVQLIITDLMLPGRSGFELLQILQVQPALRGAARLAAFSAGLTAERRARLRSLGVIHCFDKPIAVRDLVDGVRALLAPGEPVLETLPAPLPEDPFGGDSSLRNAFVQTCLQQWPQDLEAGDAALAAHDVGRLQRVAHNLKGSLRLLSAGAEADLALALERLCAAGGGVMVDAALPWATLAQAVRDLASKVANSS